MVENRIEGASHVIQTKEFSVFDPQGIHTSSARFFFLRRRYSHEVHLAYYS